MTGPRSPIGSEDVAARALAVLRAAPSPSPSPDLAARAAAAALARPRRAPVLLLLDDIAEIVRSWARPAALAACGVAVVLAVVGWRSRAPSGGGSAPEGLELVSADDVTEAVLPFALAEGAS